MILWRLFSFKLPQWEKRHWRRGLPLWKHIFLRLGISKQSSNMVASWGCGSISHRGGPERHTRTSSSCLTCACFSVLPRASGKVEESSLQNQDPNEDDPKQRKTFWSVESIAILNFGLLKWIFIPNSVTNSCILTFSISTDGRHTMSQEPSWLNKCHVWNASHFRNKFCCWEMDQTLLDFTLPWGHSCETWIFLEF